MRTSPRRAAARGMTILEATVALVVFSVVLLGAFGLLDASNRVSVSQTQVAQLQGVHRAVQRELVRLVSEAGLGGLPVTVPSTRAGASPAGVFPNGLAIAVENDVPADFEVGGDPDLRVVAGSDLLVVRGVLTGRSLVVEPQAELTLDAAGRVSVTLDPVVDLGVTQDLEPLRERLATAIADDLPEAVLVRDRFNPGAYAVMELDRTRTAVGTPGGPLTVGLALGGAAPHTEQYGRLTLGSVLLPGAAGTSVTLPDAAGTVVQLPARIGTLGLLDELWLYVREGYEVPGDDASRPTPRLARARFFPATGVLHPERSVDLASGLVDLQVAFGLDRPAADGVVAEDGSAADEVLYNHPDDVDGLGAALDMRWATPGTRLVFVRLTTIAQAAAPDRNAGDVRLGVVEDHDLTDGPFDSGDAARVRKQILTNVVEPRNLP